MFPSFLLWAQTAKPITPVDSSRLQSALQWMFVWGEPAVTVPGIWGGVITWCKVLGLITLLSWLLSKLVGGSRSAPVKRNRILDFAALGAVAVLFGCVFLQVMEQTGKRNFRIGGISTIQVLAIASFALIAIWIEARLWLGLARRGGRSDLTLLGALHLAMAVGIGSAYALSKNDARFATLDLSVGVRMGATFMGLVVLAWIVAGLLGRGRRDPVPAALCDRLAVLGRVVPGGCGPPWVVLVVFGVILAFFDWFVTSGTAEMGRSYIGSLMFLSAILDDAHDHHPRADQPAQRHPPADDLHRRLQARPPPRTRLGADARLHGARHGPAPRLRRDQPGVSRPEHRRRHQPGPGRRREVPQGRPGRLRPPGRRAGRAASDQDVGPALPVKGSLVFIDSKNKQVTKGIDVGSEMEFRSHIEGGTPSKAIWQFGMVRDPYDPKHIIDRKIPVDSLLKDGDDREAPGRDRPARAGVCRVILRRHLEGGRIGIVDRPGTRYRSSRSRRS